MKHVKEKRDTKLTMRLTASEKRRIDRQAEIYQMNPSDYARDKILNGKERNNYYRRIMYTRLVETSHAVDCVYDYISRTDSDYVSKAELIPFIDNIKKGCEALWKR